jgi:hypothetical protein
LKLKEFKDWVDMLTRRWFHFTLPAKKALPNLEVEDLKYIIL